jgi:acetyl-CoA C-acetyltransferase
VRGEWRREDPAAYQADILDQEHPPVTENPRGAATVETYTVLHGRKGLQRGLVIGRLADGSRFIAETPDDAETLGALMANDALGLAGTVSQVDGKNLFVPG